MLDKSFIGKEYEPFSFEVEKGRIRQFAGAIGDDNPIYRDEAAAKAAGYSAIPAPPTFGYVAIMDADQAFTVLRDIGADVSRSLHGEQWFTYHAPIHAGDVLSGRQKIVDIFDKKNGALEFIVTEVSLTNQTGAPVCDMRSVVVVRN
ncbi:MAG: MaoC family dehydratase N-terminal domain-containing protein [Proteobacteria bacterium]|nr:MaoC family dehydratase N-terminal domain-containing protein [Pseudomonadota bacterium]